MPDKRYPSTGEALVATLLRLDVATTEIVEERDALARFFRAMLHGCWAREAGVEAGLLLDRDRTSEQVFHFTKLGRRILDRVSPD